MVVVMLASLFTVARRVAQGDELVRRLHTGERVSMALGRNSTPTRAKALAHVAFLAVFVGLAVFQPAFADYLGKPVIDWVARWLIIPGGIISLIIAGFCAIWRPDYMMRGIYSFIVCLALLFIIKSADFLVNLLQQQLG